MTALRADSRLGPVDSGDDVPRPPRRDNFLVPRVTIQAFCQTQETAAAFERAGQDRCMSRAHLKVQMGGIHAAVATYSEAQTPNVVVLESTERRENLLRELAEFAPVCDPSTKVVIIGHVNDITLYRELIGLGISEYIVAPVTAVELVEAIAHLYRDPSAKPIGRAIGFMGAKGGVGASMLAHNVAWVVAKEMTVDALLADLDLPFGTANLDFNLDPTQGIADAVFAPDRLDQNFLDRLMARYGEHMTLLAAPSTLDRTYDLGEGAFEPIMDLARASAPVVVLDLPHMWTSWTKRTLISCDDIVVVAEPDLANLRNTKNLFDLLKQSRPNDSPPKLVLNRVGVPKRPEISPADFSKSLDISLTAAIPFDAQLFGKAANNGQMLLDVQKTSKVAEGLRQIAEAVVARPGSKKSRGRGVLGRVRALFE